MPTSQNPPQAAIPATQVAVQLVGPNELVLNRAKSVPTPGPFQILVQTEAVGLCFSDMKLLHQFNAHVRKSGITTGISAEVLAEIPSYVPGDLPTVPGHEVVCRVVKVGDQVRHYTVGERWIVQADYRTLKTSGSNGAFGYNFEGGLQEYILLDERVIGDPSEENAYMIRVPDDRSASQVALVEPWACVENSYVTPERQTIKDGGHLLIVVDEGRRELGLERAFSEQGGPAQTTRLLDPQTPLSSLPDEAFDDIVYFGSKPEAIEALNDKLAKGGILNVVLDGAKIGRPVNIGVGRIHYGGTRWVGTLGADPAESYQMIPETGEVRPNDRILIVGAGGPMGQMHVIRDVCMELEGVTVLATDVSEARLDALRKKVGAVGKSIETALSVPSGATFSYFALMAPIPVLVEDAISKSAPPEEGRGAIVNIFAGIPAPVKHPLDLDTVIERRVFLFGTSGSEPRDMRSVLAKVVSGSLDTNTSVAAVSGMAGATEGLMAVENRTMDGKIIVYPSLHDVGLIPLPELETRYPTVFARLRHGQWTPEAEAEFLAVAAR